MSTQEHMTIDERYKYLRLMQPRYLKATRKERTALLDEMQQVTGQHRKSLIRRLKGDLQRRPRRKERGNSYGAAVDEALRVIGESLDWICAERLTPHLRWMAEHLAAHGELETSPELLRQLEQISIPTVRRHIQRLQQDEPRLPRKGPERANRVAQAIPMGRIAWNEAQPGHLEIDLVHHSGPTTQGDYVHTLQMIDVATGWSERVALLGRSYLVLRDAVHYIQTRLPFPIRELHPDNGAEFLNAHLIRYCRHLVPDLELSRSRPYQKNDNRFVEQKNHTLVRRYFGKVRFDSVDQVLLMNQIYDDMWLYYNFFQPVMRLADKVVLQDHGAPARIKRVFDTASTPFDRLCNTQAISDPQRAKLHRLRSITNPRQLRAFIYAARQQLFALPPALDAQSQNVYDTLFFPDDLPAD